MTRKSAMTTQLQSDLQSSRVALGPRIWPQELRASLLLLMGSKAEAGCVADKMPRHREWRRAFGRCCCCCRCVEMYWSRVVIGVGVWIDDIVCGSATRQRRGNLGGTVSFTRRIDNWHSVHRIHVECSERRIVRLAAREKHTRWPN